MKNILHISDLHASTQVLRMDEYKIKNMMTALLDDINNVGTIDTVFITGDLTFSAKDSEYNLVKEQIIQPIIERLGVEKKIYLLYLAITTSNETCGQKAINPFRKGLFSPYDENEIDEIFQEKTDSGIFNWFDSYNNLKRC